jgi:transposase
MFRFDAGPGMLRHVSPRSPFGSFLCRQENAEPVAGQRRTAGSGLLRALAIRQLGDGHTATEAAARVRLTPKAVRALAARYRQGGLERALYDKHRPGKKQLLDTPTRQRLLAMVCGQPPVGRARWSVRLVVTEALRRRIVPRLGPQTLRLLLESHALKPWREKNVVCG